jgi:hypothetical protein
MNDGSTAAVQDAAHEVKRTANVQITDIDMPVLVWRKGLYETGAFLRGFPVETV